MSNNGRRPLFKKRSAPPPSATMTMLKSMLDEPKRPKKSGKTKPRKQQPCLEEVSNTPEKTLLPTRGLEDAPINVSKRMISRMAPPKLRKVDAAKADGKQAALRQPGENALLLSKPKAAARVPQTAALKEHFSMTLNIGRGKKRTRDRPSSSLGNHVLLDEPSSRSLSSKKDVIKFDSEALSESAKAPYSLNDSQTTSRTNKWAPEEASLESGEPLGDYAPEESSFQHSAQTMNHTNKKTKITSASELKRKVNNDNFVRLNMKNNAGACRGARNKSSRFKRKGERTNNNMKVKKVIQSGVDPLDDFMDGVYTSKNDKPPKAPCCARHGRPCKLLVVKKNTTGNKGRQFYVCPLPRGEQCDYFEWADNTVEAAQQALARNTSFSGFVARQVAAYAERFQTLTVPELQEEAKRQNLAHRGKRKQLLMRLSLWVRDEVVRTSEGEMATAQKDGTDEVLVAQEDDDDSDDFSVSSDSSEELELCHSMELCRDNEVMEGGTSSKFNDGDENHSDHDNYESCDSIVVEPPTKASTEPATPLTLQERLQELFGHEEFRDGQEWAIKRCLEKQRSLIVAPTGFGKSLCYTLPAALMDGVCIVVSPLISLMQDQLRQLPPRIPAATLSGSLTAAAMASTIDDIIRNRLKIVFVSPERLASPSFRRLFQTRWNEKTKTDERSFPAVSLLCVDEAHCVSQWGHNFRPSYLRLKSMLELMQPKSVLAMTATAGPLVVKDICDVLQIPCSDEIDSLNAGVKVLAYDRDNIDVCCKVMSSEDERLSLLKKILTESKKKKVGESTTCLEEGCLAHGSVIVYVWRQRDTEVVAENLMASGIEGGVVLYHGGMDYAARAKAQSRFMRGKARVCVATVAFGMGINKADVVGVVHLYLPSSPESYLQETGRAGRDGRPARAIALILDDEVVVKHSLAHSDMLSTSQIRSLLQILRNQILATLNAIGDDIGQKQEDVTKLGLSLHIALPFESTVKAIDCKIETIETLLSIIEEADRQEPLLKIQGTMTDQATITLKRRSLEKLSKMEKLAECIKMCESCPDSPEVAKNLEEEDSYTQEKRFLAYSFGSHTFSITRCACLLGPSAEPRHVFAALRRLQNLGELELFLDGTSTGSALHVKVEPRGVQFLAGCETSLDEMADDLARRVSTNVTASAKKALDAKHILHRVASVNQSATSETDTSPSLTLFRELIEAYFDGREIKDAATNADEELPRRAKPSMRNELRIDVSSLLRDMKTFPNFQQSSSSVDLDILCPESRDYAALAMTKFMHGLDTPRVPYAGFSRQPLYGKWRDVEFSSLLNEIEGILDPGTNR